MFAIDPHPVVYPVSVPNSQCLKEQIDRLHFQFVDSKILASTPASDSAMSTQREMQMRIVRLQPDMATTDDVLQWMSDEQSRPATCIELLGLVSTLSCDKRFPRALVALGDMGDMTSTESGTRRAVACQLHKSRSLLAYHVKSEPFWCSFIDCFVCVAL